MFLCSFKPRKDLKLLQNQARAQQEISELFELKMKKRARSKVSVKIFWYPRGNSSQGLYVDFYQ
jgi:hypothetical protein